MLASLLCVVPLASGLVPVRRLARPARAHRPQASIAMLVNAPAPSDAFGKVAEAAGPAADFFAKSGPKVGELTSKSAVAGAALLASALAPGGVIGAGAGLLIGGGLTRIGVAPALVEGRYKAMQAKVAGLLRDAAKGGDWTRVTAGDVKAVVEEYDLPASYATALLCQIYTKYLLEVMRMPDVKTSEMNDLAALRGILGLGDEAVGNAHYDVAVEVYGQLQWTSSEALEDPDSAEYRTISKLLFLSDRAFSTSAAASDEAYGYEVGRVRAVFSLERAALDARCSAVAAPFYERALAGTLEKLDGVDGAMLERARAKLGVTDATAKEMHEACYLGEVDRLLGLGTGAAPQLSDEDAARLAKLAEVLGIPAAEALETTAARTVPLYVEATRKAVDEAIAADEAAQKTLGATLDALRADLRLDAATAEAVFKDAIKATLEAPYAAATSALKLQNTPGALASLGRLMDVRRGVDVVVATAPFLKDAEGAAAFAETLAGGGKSVPLALYKLVYTEKADTLGEAETKQELAGLAKTLALTDQDTTLVREQILAPKLDLLLAQATQGASTDLARVNDWIAEVDAPAAMVKAKYLRAYADRLRAGGEVIPTEERAKELALFQDALSLTDEDVYEDKRSLAFPLYQKSALEAMGVSGGGIVAEEYAQGLEKLQARLGLRDADCRDAFERAAVQRLKPMVEDTVTAYEEATMTPAELANKRGVDQGEDLNAEGGGTFGIETGAAAMAGGSPEKVLSEFAAVVDFLEGNDLMAEELGDAPTFKVDASKLVPASLKADLYKQCVVADLQVSDDAMVTDGKKARYARTLGFVPALIGLDDADAAKAKADVGSAIARKYCSAALQQKLTLDAADQGFVSSLAERLGVELGDVAFAAKKDALLSKLAGGGGYKDEGEADRAAAFRDAAVAMGIDPKADLGLPKNRLLDLFAAEAAKAVEEGDGDAVADVADGYGLSAEEASKALEQLAARVSLECIDNAKASVIMGKPVEACEALDRLLVYEAFAGLEAGKLKAQAGNKAGQLAGLYADYQNSRGPEAEAKAATLKELLN